MPELTGDTKAQVEIYERLHHALVRAAQHEAVFNERITSKNESSKNRLGELTGVTLPQLMGRLIGDLELHTPFQSLGRYIRSFSDAEFVVRKLKAPIVSQLKSNGITDAYIPVLNLVHCCSELTQISLS